MALGLSTSRLGIGSALAFAINARFMAPKSWVSTDPPPLRAWSSP